MLAKYFNIDLGEQGVSSVQDLMAKVAVTYPA